MDTTTLVCLFHHEAAAQAAVQDLRQAGFSDSAITVLGDGASTSNGDTTEQLNKLGLAELGMPDRDYDHLKQGVREGGTVVSVTATDTQADTVENIFAKHSAGKIDEAEAKYAEPALAAVPPATGVSAVEAEGGVIPVVAEELLVGKRSVDAGGVRLFRRVVEIPVEESVVLREERIHMDRVPVDRPVSSADAAFQPLAVELTETEEVAVVGKEARVVEEIVVNKAAVEHTETVHETLRHTEVAVEELQAEPSSSTVRSTK